MFPDIKDLISIFSLLGLGGIAGSYITFKLNRNKELEFRVREQKEKRYKSCLLYMDAYFRPKNIKYLSKKYIVINQFKKIFNNHIKN